MLLDPQSVTVGGTTISLPRTGSDKGSSDYTSADGTSQLRVAQTTNSTSRKTTISLKTNTSAADPISSLNSRKSSLWTISNTAPLDGFTVVELRDQLIGLANALTASTGALAAKALGGEK
jgi:biopolymer transport protein ExbB/TolQ